MTDRYAREDHPMTEGRVRTGAQKGAPEYRYDPKQDTGDDQNGNVSRLLNDVQKQLAIFHEELGGLAHRLQAASRSVPMDGDSENNIEGPRPPMSPLAESVQIVLSQLREATARVREIKAGVDL